MTLLSIGKKRAELTSDSELKKLLEWGEKFAEEEGIMRKNIEKSIKWYSNYDSFCKELIHPCQFHVTYRTLLELII